MLFAASCPVAKAADAAGSTQLADAANSRVRALFRQAYAAYNARNYQESRDRLLEAWAIRPTYDVASALAQSELKLQLYRDATTHLQACLDTFAPSASEQTLEAIKQAYAEAKAHVGTLRITTGDGATVSMDGRPVGVAPLTSPVYAEPGAHELEFKQGKDSSKKSIQVNSGADLNIDAPLEHTLTQTPATPAPRAVKSRTPVVDSASNVAQRDRFLVPAIIDGALFAVGVTMAIGFHLAANADDSHAEDLRQRVGPNGCAAGMPSNPDCAELLDTARSKDSHRNLSTAGIVLSVASLAAVPVVWLWPRANSQRGAETSRLRLGGSVNSSYSGLALTGSF